VDLHIRIGSEVDLDLRSLDEMGRKTEVKILVEVIGGPGRQDHKSSAGKSAPTVRTGAAGNHPSSDPVKHLDPVA
jgi:hypothetical protein